MWGVEKNEARKVEVDGGREEAGGDGKADEVADWNTPYSSA